MGQYGRARCLVSCATSSRTFGWAGSMAGGVDFSTFTNIGYTYAVRPYTKNNAGAIYCKPSCGYIRTIEVQLMIDCGEDDFFLEGNNALHDILSDGELNIATVLIEDTQRRIGRLAYPTIMLQVDG